MLYKQSIDSYVDAAELLNLKVYLFDVHQKDNVYRLNYYVTDINDNVLNYLVFMWIRIEKGGLRLLIFIT
jgi:hypothetical protein